MKTAEKHLNLANKQSKTAIKHMKSAIKHKQLAFMVLATLNQILFYLVFYTAYMSVVRTNQQNLEA